MTVHGYGLRRKSHKTTSFFSRLCPRIVDIHIFSHSPPIPYLHFKIRSFSHPSSVHQQVMAALHFAVCLLEMQPCLIPSVSMLIYIGHYTSQASPRTRSGTLSFFSVPRALLMRESGSWNSNYKASWFSTVSLSMCRISSIGLSAAKPASLFFSAKNW